MKKKVDEFISDHEKKKIEILQTKNVDYEINTRLCFFLKKSNSKNITVSY